MNDLRTIILQITPRILGFMDRTVGSATYGCCDRYDWHYQLHDVSNARFQEAGLFLTLLFNNNFEGNVYFRRPAVKEWILACIKFWTTLIHREGYVSEIYPFERSFCATAFSTFATLESLILLFQSDPEMKTFLQQCDFQRKILRVGKWIIRNGDEEVTNQLAAAAVALSNISQYAGDPMFRAAAERLIDKIMNGYKKNGFYNEYGGFDIGYSSITNSLLSWYCQKNQERKDLLEIIRQCNARIDQETDDQGRYDPRDKSRKTQFLYPFGFWANRSPVFDKILKGIKNNSVITPLWMDDRYCVALAIDYLKAYVDATQLQGAES